MILSNLFDFLSSPWQSILSSLHLIHSWSQNLNRILISRRIAVWSKVIDHTVSSLNRKMMTKIRWRLQYKDVTIGFWWHLHYGDLCRYQGPPQNCWDCFDRLFVPVWHELLGVPTVRPIWTVRTVQSLVATIRHQDWHSHDNKILSARLFVICVLNIPGIKQLNSPETRHWSSVWTILAAHSIQLILSVKKLC